MQTYIQAIKDLPDLLAAAVEGLNDAQLDTPYREGGWTLRQVVHHVADSHINSYVRMRLMVSEENPTLQAYNENIWATYADAQTVPLDDSLSLLKHLHRKWALFLSDLKEADWAKTGLHTENGEVRLADVLPYYAQHGAHHAKQITDFREKMGW